MNDNYKNWQYHLDKDNILWLGFDREHKSVNSLSQESLNEFGNIITKLAARKLEGLELSDSHNLTNLANLSNQQLNNNIRGLIIYSKKPSGFIAGADITEFLEISTPSAARKILENGHHIFKSLENLNIPTVAMIDGFCLGGGCELVLACDYRVASNNLNTKIGLPEAMLGIIPGWGGTVRMTRLIGGLNALPLLMEGRAISSSQAVKFGLIDACVAVRQLKKTARYFIFNKPKKAVNNVSFLNNLSNYRPFRGGVAYFARKKLASKVKAQHYPAPYAILDNFEKYGVDNLEKSFNEEVNADLRVIEHPTAKNLIRVFFLQEKLKEFAKKLNLNTKQNNNKIKHVHVIGAGTMGGDIAAWCAFKGLKVTLQDQTSEAIAPALARAFKLFKGKVKKDDLANLILDRIIPDVSGEGVRNADLIIEAVFEDLKVKQEIFKKLEKTAKPEAILATNTSSILLDDINQILDNKSRLVGIHFFNPVAKMMLVEVVSGKLTDPNVAARAYNFVNQISKLPLPVASSPGFLVNRILSAYMHETFMLLAEGYQPAIIDQAMKNFGMPMGPVEMADIVGLDICLSVAKNISEHYHESVPEILKVKVAAKELGKKTNKGFYNYKAGKIVHEDKAAELDPVRSEEIIDRLVMRILNISIACLREQVVASDDLLDAGMIFGSGFAPFTGGPINYLNTIGKDEVIAKLAKLEKKHGKRFALDTGFANFDGFKDVRGSYAAA
jgi:3-hydroxyacyl-CoA dehydrogenase/enoyl-CoA hydratase/3-hydroxybutyryl-CoA epimerase